MADVIWRHHIEAVDSWQPKRWIADEPVFDWYMLTDVGDDDDGDGDGDDVGGDGDGDGKIHVQQLRDSFQTIDLRIIRSQFSS